MHGEVPCLFKACLGYQYLPYQHISFFPIPYRALQSKKKCIISIFKRQKRPAEIGLPHYQGFCKSRNNVAGQDLCCLHKPHQGPHLLQQQLAHAQTSVLVSRWPDKSKYLDTHPPLPCRCMNFRWPVQSCKDVYSQGALSIYSIPDILLKKTSLSPQCSHVSTGKMQPYASPKNA